MNIQELLKGAEPAENTGKTKSSRDAISISLMCYDNKKINRITFSNALYEKLGRSKEVQFAFRSDLGKVLLATRLPDCRDTFRVVGANWKHPRPIINSGSLIKGFISKFGLDFSTRHNQLFSDITFDALNGAPVAVINISKKDPETKQP